MIVEFVVVIVVNIFLESCDVVIMYLLFGDLIMFYLMEVEKGGLLVVDGVKGEGSEVDVDEDGDKNSKSKIGMWVFGCEGWQGSVVFVMGIEDIDMKIVIVGVFKDGGRV